MIENGLLNFSKLAVDTARDSLLGGRDAMQPGWSAVHHQDLFSQAQAS
ncbi:hypothetical protein JCM19240_1539 [Vibrio maritimus]|uniref:Uncharacterized protein n=1 Tax=Vibrio maritimus TaxID=990268 RepID=A0A090TZ09_9VIBR|nr:hypothetical protein JCM19240_1539 [Vibrio maritimus]